jgi:hypothetical protein
LSLIPRRRGGAAAAVPRQVEVIALAGQHQRQPVDRGDDGRRGIIQLSLSQIPSGWREATNRAMLPAMADILKLICWAVIGLFRSRASLEAEILTLRQQLNVLRRNSPKRLAFSNVDRLIFAGLYQIAPRVLDALTIVEPETVVRWHRAGFRLFWRWKSRQRGGRPKVELEIRQLIREMSLANPLWGAPRIHGELLKLGIDLGQTSVAKYMAKRRRPPSQGWKTFLRKHAASMDLFFVPTISFRLLYGLLIMRHGRCQMLWLGVTEHPTAEWVARQLTEACGWGRAPRYIVRDRDCIYGEIFKRRLRAIGIRDRPTARRSPWQNGHTERLIGSIRRECLDHVVISSERHLRHVLLSYMGITMAATHICLWIRMRRRRELFRLRGAFFRCQFSADYIITMFGSDFRQAQQDECCRITPAGS